MNLDTKPGVLRFCEQQQREMVRCFERLGRYEGGKAHGKGLDLAGWKTGQKLDQVSALPCQLPRWVEGVVPHRQHTVLFGETLRSYAKLTRAIGTLIMSETWHLHTVGEPGKSAEEIRGQYPDDLEDAPDRQEALMLRLEHSAAGRIIWFAVIKRHPTRLEPWQDMTPADATGRLMNLSDWRS
jgi:hypothetical protein